MAKDKKGSKAAAPKTDTAKPLESVKAGRVTKPVEKAAKETAKKVANGVEKAAKKVKKAVSPEPSDDDTSDSSESSDEEVASKANGKHAASDDEDDSDSDSGSSDSDSEEETAPKKVAAPKTNGKHAASDDESDDDSDGSSDSSDSDEEVPAKAGAKDDDSGSDSDSSDDSEDESEAEDKPAAKVEDAGKKRKADEAIDNTPKKTKISVNGEMKEPTANLFVGNLSWNVDEDWLTREFEEYGELQGVRIITDRDSGRSKGYGYVEFVSADNAAEALEAKQGAPIDGREIRIDFSAGRQQKTFDNNATPQQRSFDRAARFGDTPREPSMTLFVGNVSFNADESSITEMFQEYGTITGVRLPTDRETGALKGYGYVDYTSIDEAKAAYEALQGADLAGRAMRLDYSTPRSNDSPGGGRGFGGRGGGRGGFNDRGRGGFGGRGGGRGGFGDRGGRGGRGGGRGRGGNSTNRGGFGDFSGKKVTF